MNPGSIEKISLKWGAITFILLSLYFIIMKAVGLIHVIELRTLNFGIMFFGVFMAIKESKLKLEEFTYLKGIGTGLLTSMSASLIFTLFGFVYLDIINPSFLNEIRANELFGMYINKYGAVLQILIEGSASGCLISYAVMQYLKIPRLSEQKN